MSNNNNPPPAGNNNNKKKKRKTTHLAIPTADENSGQKKRRTDPQPASSPVMGPPAQAGSGFGNPTNPSAYAPMPTLYAGSQPVFPPFATTSTAFAPQYSNSQDLPQWPQQQPQHVPRPSGYLPVHHMQPMFTSSNIDFTAGQQQVTRQAPKNPQDADSSPEQVKNRPVELFRPADLFVADDPGDGRVPKIEHKEDPNMTNIAFETTNPNTTISRVCGDRGRDVLRAQINHHQSIHDGEVEIYAAMTARPLMSRSGPASQVPQASQSNWSIQDRGPEVYTMMTSVPLMSKSAPARQVGEASQSTVGLAIPTNTGGRRQKPGTAPAQAPDQDQGHAACPNCGREDHLVGDCVGPPNPVHGDLPACPVCNTFAGKAKNSTGTRGHRFDDCPKVEVVFHSHRWEKNHRLTLEDLARLSDGQLEMFFRALIMRRLRKSPIRTQLVCWIDLLREVARRYPDSVAIHSLGNMTPWTKDFAKQQRDSAAPLVKPWDGFDYATGNTLMLPVCPVAQVGTTWDNFVADGFPHFPPQVFNSDDRPRPSEKTDIDVNSNVDSPKAEDTSAVAQQPKQVQQPAPVPNLFGQQGQQPPQVPNLFAQQPAQTVAPGLVAPPPRRFGDDVPPDWTPGLYSGSAEQFRSAANTLANRPSFFPPTAGRPSASNFLSSLAPAGSAHRQSTTASQPDPETASEGQSSQ